MKFTQMNDQFGSPHDFGKFGRQSHVKLPPVALPWPQRKPRRHPTVSQATSPFQTNQPWGASLTS